MTDPRRLSGSGGLTGALLAAAKADRSPDGAQHKALVAGVAAVALTTQASSAAAAASVVARALASKWLSVGLLGVGTVLAARTVWVSAERAGTFGAASSLHAGAPAETKRATPVSPPRDEPATVLSSAPSASVGAAAAPVVPRSVAPSLPSARPPATGLSAEVALLDHARQTLQHGDATLAAHEVDGYRASFPEGALAAEATALKIEALTAAGLDHDARVELARLRRESPDSPLLDNLTRTLRARP